MNTDKHLRRLRNDICLECMAWQTTCEQVLSEIRGRRIHLQLSTKDQLRMLNLRVWSLKYKVSLDFIFQTLTKFWDGKNSYRSFGPPVLSCRVSVFTGKKSESVIQEAIKREFPNNEHLRVWQSNLRNKFISFQKPIADILEDPDKFMRNYSQVIKACRTAMSEQASRLSSKKFRDNPFIG